MVEPPRGVGSSAQAWFRKQSAGHDPDFEDGGPSLAGQPQPSGLPVDRDAVENLLGIGGADLADQWRRVDPAGDLAGGRIDVGDPRRLPDVGKNLAVDQFELVEQVDWKSPVAHVQ